MLRSNDNVAKSVLILPYFYLFLGLVQIMFLNPIRETCFLLAVLYAGLPCLCLIKPSPYVLTGPGREI